MSKKKKESKNLPFLIKISVVMSFLHKKIWIQSLQSLLSSQDNYLDTVCYSYSNVTLSQYSLRYPISEMNFSCFRTAINNFKRLDSDNNTVISTKHQQLAFTPLEKLTVLKTTLDLISSAVCDYIQDFGNGISGECHFFFPHHMR